MRLPGTILVTGGTGYLGSRLVRRLAQEGHSLVLLKRSKSKVDRIIDLLPRMPYYNIGQIEFGELFERHQIKVVIHCATQYGRGSLLPLEIVEANLLLPLQLLQVGASHGLKLFVNTDTILDMRVSEYSLSKKQFLDWLRTYQSRLVCASLALEHFYGPGDDPTKFVSWVAAEFQRQVPRLDLTPGEQKRDFVYIDDVVDAFVIVLRFASGTSPGFYGYEVGTGTRVTVRELVEQIQKRVGTPQTEVCLGALPYRSNEVMESKVDLEPLHALGWRPRVSLEQGLDLLLGIDPE